AGLLARATGVHATPVHARSGGGAAAFRLYPVRRGATPMHRRQLRANGGAAHSGRRGPALPAGKRPCVPTADGRPRHPPPPRRPAHAREPEGSFNTAERGLDRFERKVSPLALPVPTCLARAVPCPISS